MTTYNLPVADRGIEVVANGRASLNAEREEVATPARKLLVIADPDRGTELWLPYRTYLATDHPYVREHPDDFVRVAHPLSQSSRAARRARERAAKRPRPWLLGSPRDTPRAPKRTASEAWRLDGRAGRKR